MKKNEYVWGMRQKGEVGEKYAYVKASTITQALNLAKKYVQEFYGNDAEVTSIRLID